MNYLNDLKLQERFKDGTILYINAKSCCSFIFQKRQFVMTLVQGDTLVIHILKFCCQLSPVIVILR